MGPGVCMHAERGGGGRVPGAAAMEVFGGHHTSNGSIPKRFLPISPMRWWRLPSAPARVPDGPRLGQCFDQAGSNLGQGGEGRRRTGLGSPFCHLPPLVASGKATPSLSLFLHLYNGVAMATLGQS